MKQLWKPKQSVTLSLVVTYLAGAALLALMAAMPWLLNLLTPRYGYGRMAAYHLYYLMWIFYACCPAGWAAIVSLLKLLHNIRAGKVFTRQNVKLLRLLSWCFIFVTLIAIPATVVDYYCGIVFVAAGFLAIILRVVKNVIAEAALLREENDLTI